MSLLKFWDTGKKRIDSLHGNAGAALFTNQRRMWREDFAGTALNPALWQVVQTGAGQTIAVADSNLTITSGTTPNSETIIRSVEAFSLPLRASFIMMLSQRIANQEFILEVVDATGEHRAQIRMDGTVATTAMVDTFNAGLSIGAVANTTETTAAFNHTDIDIFQDIVSFGRVAVNSTVARASTPIVRTQRIPDPNLQYHIQIRVRNLAVVPASSTTLTLDAITVEDLSATSVEILGGSGLITGAQCIGTLPQGGSVGTVSFSHSQSINTSFADTSTPLSTANAIFTGTARDFGTIQRTRSFRAISTADVAGTLFIEQSNDGTNWIMTHRQDTATLADADAVTRHIAFIDVPVANRFARVRYRNGATAQTAFRVISMQCGI